MRPRRLQALALLILLLAALAWQLRPRPPSAPPFVLDSAYLWQRQWTDAVRAALQQTGSLRELRVLALEVDAEGRVVRPPVDLAALAAANGRLQLVPVVRIDGRRPPLPATELGPALAALVGDWRAAGIGVAEVELDHDCARSGLGQYRDWIADLRPRLPAGLRIAITGLPDWLHSAQLPALRAAVDGFTLQVHAVDRPEAGLFDTGRAEAWLRRYARIAPGAFHVALPTYSARVRGQLLWAEPEAVEALLARLRADPPPGLAGVRWFRLPLPGSGETWAMATLQALISGQPRSGQLELRQLAQPGGGIDLRLANPAAFDLPLPDVVSIEGECSGDAVAGWRLRPTAPGRLQLQRGAADRLAPGTTRALGWLRCRGTPRLWIGQ